MPVFENQSRMQMQLSDLIERIDIHRTDKINMKLKTFYNSCMDVDSIRTKGFIPGKFERDFKKMLFLYFVIDMDFLIKTLTILFYSIYKCIL